VPYHHLTILLAPGQKLTPGRLHAFVQCLALIVLTLGASGTLPAQSPPATESPVLANSNSTAQPVIDLHPEVTAHAGNASCEGSYARHLQGVCVDDNAIYWSFTTDLVKTDLAGGLIKKVAVANHHGDLCLVDDQIYVAVNLGKFNDPAGNADSWVYVYDAQTLEEQRRFEVQDVFHGAGGIGHRAGQFYVVGGLPDGIEENYAYQYDTDFRLIKKHTIKSGHTKLGIQTATFANGRWWLGCYGSPPILLVTDAEFKLQGRYVFDCSLGIVGLPDGRLLVGGGRCEREQGCVGGVQVAIPCETTGLCFVDQVAGAK